MERLLGHNERICGDLVQAKDTIEEMERSVLLKVGLMYLAVAVLGLAIVFLLFKKLFY